MSISNKKQIRESFSFAAKRYDRLAKLQYQVARDLWTNKINHSHLKGCCIDLGCGTGFLSQQLLKNSSFELFAVDIAQPMLDVMRGKMAQADNIHYICADAETLPFAQQTMDLIVSNLVLQWCQNMTALFSGFYQLLKPHGRLIFSTFGPATLQELKKAWSVVDNHSHVNTFFSIDHIQSFLIQAGFNKIQIESKIYPFEYDSVMRLMRELKGIGAHHVLSKRNKQITSKKDLDKMLTAYESYRVNGKIPATYEVIFVSARVNQ